MEDEQFKIDFTKAKNKVFKGRKKEAICRLVVREDPEIKNINGKQQHLVINSSFMISKITYPLKLVGANFGYKANLVGGGVGSMCIAIRAALSKAIVTMCPEAKKTIKKEGFLTVDNRRVMPKKPGMPKARKKRQRSRR